jgi:hypothetical protein
VSITIHLDRLGRVGWDKGFELFRLTNEEIAEWERKGRAGVRYHFIEELFDEVSVPNISVTRC